MAWTKTNFYMFEMVRRLAKSIFTEGHYIALNVVALSFSVAVALFLFFYVDFESNYDSFHPEPERVYRAESRLWQAGALSDNWATTSYGHAPALARHIPQIESYVRVTAQDREQVVSWGDKSYPERRYCYTEPEFFKIFNYPIVEGDRLAPLDRPQTVVISQSAAKRYFGNEEPLGKTLKFRNQRAEQNFEVTAVMADMPGNSNLNYDFLLSYASIPAAMRDVWYIHGVYTYLKLRPDADPRGVEELFAGFSDQYRTKALEHKDWRVELVPLREIHLNAAKPYEKEVKGSRPMLVILSIMAFALLVVAWVNFLGVAVARSLEQAQRTVLSRIYGASGGSIVRGYMLRAAAINFVSMLLAVGMLFGLILFLRAEISLQFGLVELLSVRLLLMILAIMIVGTLVVGLYPALVVVRVKLVQIMRGRFTSSPVAVRMRRVLVVVQFAASFVLVAGTLVVFNQLSFMRDQPLGLAVDNRLVVKYPAYIDGMQGRIDGFRERIKAQSTVDEVSVSGAIPGIEVANYFSLRPFGAEASQGKLVQMLVADFNYTGLYDMQMVAGRRFDAAHASTDSMKIIINEAALPLLGFDNAAQAVGQQLTLEVVRDPLQVVGVARDFHQLSPREPYRATAILLPERLPMVAVPYISIQIADGASRDQALADVRAAYDEFFPLSPIDYFFLDDFYDSQYRADRNFGVIFGFSSILALVVACVGLWVVAVFSMRHRGREIALRKIYGGSRGGLFALMMREFALLTLVAGVLGSVAASFLLSVWLSGYALSVGVSWWVYPLALVCVMGFGLAAVAGRVAAACRVEPAAIFRG